MENRVSYIIIGIFVFLFGISTVAFILWLGKYAHNDVFKYYKVITQESVSGLNPKAPVKLRGVSVGEVKEIYISKRNSEDVVVLIQVKEGTPIKEDTHALINLQGITGLSYIELQGGMNDSKALKTGIKDKDYGIIRTKSSMLERVDQTLSSIGKKTEKVLDRTSDVMNEKNLQNFELILQNLVNVTNSLNSTLLMVQSKNEQLDKVLDDAHTFELSATKAADAVRKMADDLGKSANITLIGMKEAADKTYAVMDTFDGKLQDGKLDLDILIRENLLPVQNDLEDLRTLINSARGLVDELRDSPSDLIFRQSNTELSPNEKGNK